MLWSAVMHTPKVVMLLAFALVTPAAAEIPYSCLGGTVKKMSISSTRKVVRIDALIPSGLDPVTNGLSIEVNYEPEADPTNLVYSVALPKTGFVARPGGSRYTDNHGLVGGVRHVVIKDADGGMQRVKILRNGTVLPGTSHAGNLRVAFGAGSACARTCGSPCSVVVSSNMRCTASTDTALCGSLSGCELLNVSGGNCLLPYPSSVFETDDGSTATGKRIAYLRRGTPVNNMSVHIDPVPWNTLDGFSPGSMMLVAFPHGVDLTASNVPPLTNFGASLDPGSPVVLIDADTLDRIELFGENDVSLGPGNIPVAPPTQTFIIRPGRRLKNDHRYIVALRGLIDQTAAPIVAEPAFQALRDGTPSGNAALEARRPHYENDIFPQLIAAGIARANLIVAWDFTTASDDVLERWLLDMRDETFAGLGPNAPTFTITESVDDPLGDPRICRRVRGTYDVPLYTTFDGPGSRLNIGPLNLPVQNGVTHAPMTIIIPCSVLNPTPHAGRAMFYGHGLFGTGDSEVISEHLRKLMDTYQYVVAATDWQGMSTPDLPLILNPTFIGDLSGFPILPERLHQGVLNQLVLGHLLGAPDGLSAAPQFQYPDGPNMVSVIDPSEVFYYGNSQGGIMGGTVMALEQETTRGVLGVPAANFSTLLQRAQPFGPYFAFLRSAYPNAIDRSLTYPFLQQLWDRSEPNGWHHHTVANPLPNTPVHKILVHMSFGDEQVANIGTEIMVRSMGLPQLSPAARSFFDIPDLAGPLDSAMVESHLNIPSTSNPIPPPPQTNIPPANYGAHGGMRLLNAIQAQIDQFLRTGGDIQNFCTGSCDPE